MKNKYTCFKANKLTKKQVKALQNNMKKALYDNDNKASISDYDFIKAYFNIISNRNHMRKNFYKYNL